MFQTLFALVMLLGVLMLLLGVNRLSRPRGYDLGHEKKLRRDVASSDDVISRDSAFHSFLARQKKSPSPPHPLPHRYRPNKNITGES